MQLVAFTMQGYRRFIEPTSLKLHSDLIALVGPNEAGKSSVLLALTHLNDDRLFDRSEIPRRSDARPELRWQLQLDAQDRAEIKGIQGSAGVGRVVITKREDGNREWSFAPVEPTRSLKTRLSLNGKLNNKTMGGIRALCGDSQIELDIERLKELLSSKEEFRSDELAEVEKFSEQFGALTAPGIEATEGAAFEGQGLSKLDETLRLIAKQVDSLLSEGREAHPRDQIRQILQTRLPVMKLYKPEDRDLKSEYDLSVDADNPPPALQHLAHVAQINLSRLRDDATRDDGQADVTTQCKAANRKLLAVFAAWKQEDLALQLDVNGLILHIQVTTPSDEGVSNLNERSDGMRWFASLLAFMHGGGENQILLADEIETHLHYDAQSDLVDLLARQTAASKIIYTTHSFGCLPNDLGNGVRVVKQIEDGFSKLQNGFWAGGAGFSPLLLSMGAAATTFTPARRAVIGEGPTEAILLPTIFRQVWGKRPSFQVAPGLSNVAASAVGDLQAEAGHVAYLVDGDKGGLSIKKMLQAAGIADTLIAELKDPINDDPLEIEDLIDPTVYVQAINDELRCWGDLKDEMTVSVIPPSMRTKSVDAWCVSHGLESPDKAAVAQRVANLACATDLSESMSIDTDRRIYSVLRKTMINDLMEYLNLALQVTTKAD